MGYTMKEKLAHPTNYGGKRDVSTIKWIVIHFTANDGDTDENNGNYFHNNAYLYASAHYFCDSDSITQSVPDDYVAWSVGGSKYPSCASTGGGKYHGSCTNYNSISIELCDDNRNGSIYPSKATIENALELTRKLMKKYGINKDHVIRHFDVVGKICPAYWCGSDANNKKWLSEFWNKLDGSEPQKDYLYLIKALCNQKIRSKPNLNCEIVGNLDKGFVYTIVTESKDADGRIFGRLKSGAGWVRIHKKYNQKV